jgi:osmotically-inducible protein OsmY
MTAIVTPASPAAVVDLARGLAELCLVERVERALRATGFPPLREVQVSVCGQLVVLQGRVPSYYMKQLAQAAAMGVAGIGELRNELQVIRPQVC